MDKQEKIRRRFDEFVEKGGKVEAIKYGDGKVRHVCKLDGKICVGKLKEEKKEKK